MIKFFSLLRKKPEKEDVNKGLSSLKEKGDDLKYGSQGKPETLQFKMPSRESVRDDPHAKIKIPVPQKFDAKKEEEFLVSSDLHKAGLLYKPEEKMAAHEALQHRDKFLENILAVSKDGGPEKEIEKNAKPAGHAEPTKDNSIFGGKDEISRIQLRQKLRKDPSVWRAEYDLRMNLTPLQRANLEKETFAPVYGRNISRKDLKINLKRLGKKWAGESDPKKKEFLRKEIKFFKKIGGIK